ncbi:MAG: sulfurase, partial [Luminiphilus sp.]|nr:sulfurase [Luminiphilus sp.]
MNKRRNPLDRYAKDLAPGRVEWIGLRPRRREPLQAVSETVALAELGLEGDHRTGKTPGSGRQVTLISREFIAQIELFTGLEGIDPATLRRNIVVSGINLNALRRQRFR